MNGWQYGSGLMAANGIAYRQELQPVKQVTLLRWPQEGQGHSHDFWVRAEQEVTKELFCKAIRAYLQTPYGKKALVLLEEAFHWGNAMMCVPPAIWAQYGIYPVGSEQRGLAPNVEKLTIEVDNREVVFKSV